MGIFGRLNQVIKANLNGLIDKAEDPHKLIGQTIIDMEAGVKTARQELVTALGTAKRLHKKHDELAAEVQAWEDKAVLALKSDDDALAREALRRKARVAQEAADARRQALAAESSAEEMRSTLDNVERKISELKAKQGTLAAQVRQAREVPSATIDGGRFGSKTFDDLARMGDRVEQMEAEIEAANVLDDPKRHEVDAKLRELERGERSDAIEDELGALKKKLSG